MPLGPAGWVIWICGALATCGVAVLAVVIALELFMDDDPLAPAPKRDEFAELDREWCKSFGVTL